MKKFTFILTAAFLWAMTASAQNIDGGTTGTLTWNVDIVGADTVLSISGTGDMPDYANINAVPWAAYRTSIDSLVIGNGVTKIGNNAFWGCSGLTSVIIPNSVTTIGSTAFYGCSELTSVTIGSSVTTIGNTAFAYCNGLTSVIIPNSVTTIGSSAFVGCSGLTSVIIPDLVTSIGDNAFSGCSGLTSIDVDNTNTAYSSEDGILFNKLKTTLIRYPIGNTNTSYSIPNSVTTIGSGAFYGCSGLTSVTIGNSVTTIGNDAFLSCSGLTSVIIGNSVTSIGDYAFDDCSTLDTITSLAVSPPALGIGVFLNVPNTIAVLVPCGSKADYETDWSYFTNIEELAYKTIAGGQTGDLWWSIDVYCNSTDTVLSISGTGDMPDYASSNAVPWAAYRTTIDSLVIGNGVTKIGIYAFYGCSELTSVTIGNSVTTIGISAFYGCNGLTSVTIGSSVTTIGNGAFANCSGLTSVSIPNSVTTIGSTAFSDCSGLTSIDVDNANTAYSSENGVLFNKSKTTLIQYPIGNTNTSYTIPNSVTAIGNNAFSNSSGLTSVTIGSSVTTIGTNAFYDCSGLDTITSLAVTPPALGTYVFINVPNTIPVYVPCGSGAAYVAWGGFSNIRELAYKTIAGGQTGDLWWSIDVYCNSTDTVLTISGTGDMEDYANINAVPWAAYRTSIDSLVIENGRAKSLKFPTKLFQSILISLNEENIISY